MRGFTKKKKTKIHIIDGRIISPNSSPDNSSTLISPPPIVPGGNGNGNGKKSSPEIIDASFVDTSSVESPPEFDASILDLSELEGIDLDEFFQNLENQELESSQKPESSPHPFLEHPEEPKFYTAIPKNSKIINGIVIPADQPYLPKSHRPELPVRKEPDFCPYLIDGDTAKSSVADFSGYLLMLESTGKSKRTRSEYSIDLRRWKRLLSGEITVEKYNAILQDCNREGKPYKAIRMRNVLKSYAMYRNIHGDPKLIIMLITSQNLYSPKAPEKKKREKLTDKLNKKEIEEYWNLAKSLCKGGKREGIWIAILMLGCPSGTLKDVEFPCKTTLKFTHWGKEKEVKIKRWLYDACESLDKTGISWRMTRKSIYNGVSQYEISPRALNGAKTKEASR